ncbi:MAG: hypothetical protein J5805_04215 [Bacteroidaceae bacterium]|nr:hypothetical protein [Bacteroidaceae bacterium]
MINILNNQTAGGWKKDIERTFNQVKDEIQNLEEIMVNQVGTGGERFPQIVCYDDSKIAERSVIEYTWDKLFANGLGLVGLITISIDPCYVNDKVSSEKGVFCVSSAPVEIVDVILKQTNICPNLTMVYDTYKNNRVRPLNMTDNGEEYDKCRCTYKRTFFR